MNDPDVARSGHHRRPVPPSLLAGDLPRFWDEVAQRLERSGDDWRGRLPLAVYDAESRRVLAALVGQQGRKTVDLTMVEAELVRLGVGTDLASALNALGRPVSPAPAARRAERARMADGRAAARDHVGAWPEPWAADWGDELISSGLLAGLGRADTVSLLADVRRVLDALETSDGERISRTELAANVLGSAHALDDGTRLERATARALGMARSDDTDDGRDPWTAIGAHRSLLAGAVVTWRLPLDPTHPLATAVQTCNDLRLPFVLTRLAIDSVGVACASTSDVLVVENPRVIEYAAQTGSAQSVVCGNGNPSTTVTKLLTLLGVAGTTLRYHGDFDVAGLEICARLHSRGLVPWRMSATDYLDALDTADAAGVRLPIDTKACGPTPWDPGLRDAFDEHRRIVHEERLLAQIIPAT